MRPRLPCRGLKGIGSPLLWHFGVPMLVFGIGRCEGYLVKRTVVLAVAAVTAFSTRGGAQVQNIDPDIFCRMIGQLAKTVMERRQNGAAISDIMSADITKEQKELLRPMALRAFEIPSFQTEKMQKRAIRNFQSDAELRCYKGLEALKNKGG